MPFLLPGAVAVIEILLLPRGLVGLLFGLLIGLLFGLLFGLLTGGLVDNLIGSLVDALVGRMVGDLVGRMVGDLVGRMVGLSVGDWVESVGADVGAELTALTWDSCSAFWTACWMFLARSLPRRSICCFISFLSTFLAWAMTCKACWVGNIVISLDMEI